MKHLLSSVSMTIFVTLGMAILLLLFIFKKVYSYWSKFNIPVIPPSIPYGSLGKPITNTTTIHGTVAKAYKKFKENNEKHGGIYMYLTPYYIPVDPVIIKNILIKDFNYFSERNIYTNKYKDPLSGSLFAANNQEWRDMRTKLTPLFTVHKLKLMLPLFQIHCDRLVKIINDCVKRREPVDIKELIGCFATDLMGSCSFGVQCNSLENSNCTFRRIIKQVFYLTPYRFFKADCTRNFPKLASFLGMVTFSKKTFDFILKVVSENFNYRVTNNAKCNDLFQSLMELDNESDESVMIKIAAQSMLFFSAGAENTSTAIMCAIYEVAYNPKIQDKLRNEVNLVLEKHNGKITYEVLSEMEYLSKVIEETLRKYPSAATLSRKCVQDYHVEGTDVVIEKGVKILLSVLAVHKDPEYYPNPEVFDPERFNEINKSKRPHCTYLPFLDGPRNCIGLKFALTQVKLGLVYLLKNFTFSVNSRTGIPKIDQRSFLYTLSDGVYIDFEKI